MSLRKQAARGVLWSAAGNWGQQITTLVVFTLLSRLLEPEDFGIAALAVVFTAFVKIVAEQGLADAIVQRADIDDEHLDAAFWASLGFGSILAVVLAAGSPLAGSLLDEPDFAPVLAAIAFGLVLRGLISVQQAILTRDLAFASLTARSLLSVTAGGVVGVGAAFAGAGVWSLVAQNLTSEFVSVLVLWRASPWRPRLRFSKRHFRDLFAFGINVVGYRTLLFFDRRSADLLIGYVLGATALGFYTIAYRLQQLVINLTTFIIDQVAFPIFAKLQADRDTTKRAYYESTQMTGLVAFPAFLGLLVAAPALTRALFGTKWDDSIPVMQILAVGGLLQSVMFLNGTVIKALGKPGWRLIITFATAALGVAAILGVVDGGIVPVAIAVTGVNYVAAPIWYWAVNRLIDLELTVYLRAIAPPLVAALVMAGAAFAVGTMVEGVSAWAQAIAVVGTGLVVYPAAMYVVGRRVMLNAVALGRSAIPGRRGHRDESL